MQFQVPQIDIEDKIFGPLTLKQFLYLATGGVIIFVAFMFFELGFVILIGIPIAAISASFAFLKYNGRPLPRIMLSMITFSASPHVFIWKKEVKPIPKAKEKKAIPKPTYIPKLTESKLKELAWSLDIKQDIYKEKS